MSEKKLKAGNVLQYLSEDGSVEEYMCWATVERRGVVSAWVQRFGLARQLVTEDNELIKQSKVLSNESHEMLAKIKNLEDSIEKLKKAPAKKRTTRIKSSASKKAVEAKDGE